MRSLVSIDPGKLTHACAVWYDRRLVKVTKNADPKMLFPGVESLVIEMPVRVHRRRGAGRTFSTDGDVIALARSAEKTLTLYEASGAKVRAIPPQQWKGTTKKPPHHSKIWSALTDAERDFVAADLGKTPGWISAYIIAACQALAVGQKPKYSSKLKDVLDAVGLGLWELGRIDKAGNVRMKL